MIPSARANASITTMTSLAPLGERVGVRGSRDCDRTSRDRSVEAFRLRREMADHRRGGADRRLAGAGSAGLPPLAKLHDASLAPHVHDGYSRPLFPRLHR